MTDDEELIHETFWRVVDRLDWRRQPYVRIPVVRRLSPALYDDNPPRQIPYEYVEFRYEKINYPYHGLVREMVAGHLSGTSTILVVYDLTV